MILQVSRFLCNARNLVEISALLSLDSVVVAAHLSTDMDRGWTTGRFFLPPEAAHEDPKRSY